MPLQLVEPHREGLPGFVAALERGWTPDSQRGAEAARQELDAVRHDAHLYLARQVDRRALGGPIVLPDGSQVPRLPGLKLWLWDGEFCGVIGLRWMAGSSELPPWCLGHVGYTVVPWKRRLGYATQALALLLPIAWREGLRRIELTTDPANLASQRVITTNGGRFVERFVKSAAFGGGEALRFRIELDDAPPAGRPISA